MWLFLILVFDKCHSAMLFLWRLRIWFNHRQAKEADGLHLDPQSAAGPCKWHVSVIWPQAARLSYQLDIISKQANLNSNRMQPGLHFFCKFRNSSTLVHTGPSGWELGEIPSIYNDLTQIPACPKNQEASLRDTKCAPAKVLWFACLCEHEPQLSFLCTLGLFKTWTC